MNATTNNAPQLSNGPSMNDCEAFLSQIMATSALNPLGGANLTGLSNLGLNLPSTESRSRNG